MAVGIRIGCDTLCFLFDRGMLLIEAVYIFRFVKDGGGYNRPLPGNLPDFSRGEQPQVRLKGVAASGGAMVSGHSRHSQSADS